MFVNKAEHLSNAPTEDVKMRFFKNYFTIQVCEDCTDFNFIKWVYHESLIGMNHNRKSGSK